MKKEHYYTAQLEWTGNKGEGTKSYVSYERSYSIAIEGKPLLEGSADPSFRGDATKYNPEELLLASLSSCHMLWFLHLCAERGIVVTDYRDEAKGFMKENPDGSGQFVEVMLRPYVHITDASKEKDLEPIHHKARQMCFIARSVNFPVRHNAFCRVDNNS